MLLDRIDAKAQKVRKSIKTSPIATSLLADLERSKPTDREGWDTIYATLKYLADIDYPPGDRKLAAYRNHVYAGLKLLAPLLIKEKYRLRGSFNGNAIYASASGGTIRAAHRPEAIVFGTLRILLATTRQGAIIFRASSANTRSPSTRITVVPISPAGAPSSPPRPSRSRAGSSLLHLLPPNGVKSAES